MKKLIVGTITLLMLITAAPAHATDGVIPGSYRFNITWNGGQHGGGRVTLKPNGHGRISHHPTTWTAVGDQFHMDQPAGVDEVYNYDGTFTGTGFCSKQVQCVFSVNGVPMGDWYGIKKT